MIVCPTHMVSLNSENNLLCCPVCTYSAIKTGDNTIYFDSYFTNSLDYDVNDLAVLYSAEQNHFWFKNRVDIIRHAFKKYFSYDKSVIEIGAGTGGVARALIHDGFHVAVGELYPKGLEYAKNYGISERYQFNIYHTPFKDHFDVCCMFDVLEHLDDDYVALKNACSMLKRDGYIVLTVPAHSWLWSVDDASSGHKRRYEQNELVNLVESAGFDVLEVRNFFLLILPLLYLRTIIRSDIKEEKNRDTKLNIQINPIINTILDIVTRIENALFSNLCSKIGGSIILIARKKHEDTI